jgi:hypothetical protein
MSYDFDLREIPPGADIDDLLAADEATIEKEIEAGIYPVVTDEQRAFMSRLAASLKEFDPRLRLVEGLHESFELYDDEDQAGITVGVYRDSVSITVPYWHRRDKVVAVFKRIWRCLEFVQRQTGYGVYDSQVGRVLDLNSDKDFSDALATYGWTIDEIDQTIRSNPPPTEP